MTKKYFIITFLILLIALVQYSFGLYIFPFWKTIINFVYVLAIILLLRLCYKLPTQDLFIWVALIIMITAGYNLHNYWNGKKIEIDRKISGTLFLIRKSVRFVNLFQNYEYTLVRNKTYFTYKPLTPSYENIASIKKISDSCVEIISYKQSFLSKKNYYDTVIVRY